MSIEIRGAGSPNTDAGRAINRCKETIQEKEG